MRSKRNYIEGRCRITVHSVKTMFTSVVAVVLAFIVFSHLYFEYFTTKINHIFIGSTNCCSRVNVSEISQELDDGTTDTFGDVKLDYKVILLWTRYFFGDIWFPPGALESRPRDYPCLVTNDRSYLKNSAAVVFHWRDIIPGDIPRYKSLTKQVWVLVNNEAPTNTKKNHFPKAANGDFDWIISYRRDSELYEPYGEIIPRTSEHPKWSMDRERFLNIKKKSKDIVWLVSNCDTPGKREDYVKELRKYIKVDIFGDCGNLGSPRDGGRFMSEVEAKYKFYLSFENSICNDYVTEKLFRAMKYDIIPVVMGGANYKDILPPNSYIDVSDFECPKNLADYLRWVGEDHQKYTSYLIWKENFTVRETGYSWVFDLCAKLHDYDRRSNGSTSDDNDIHRGRGETSDLFDWWFGQSGCREWKLPENCTEEYYIKTYGYSFRTF